MVGPSSATLYYSFLVPGSSAAQHPELLNGQTEKSEVRHITFYGQWEEKGVSSTFLYSPIMFVLSSLSFSFSPSIIGTPRSFELAPDRRTCRDSRVVFTFPYSRAVVVSAAFLVPHHTLGVCTCVCVCVHCLSSLSGVVRTSINNSPPFPQEQPI